MKPETKRLLGLALALVGAAALFLGWGVGDNWEFILRFRGQKLINMLLVAMAVGVATVVFQTLTGNRILTPSIIGLDSLYLLLQVGLIFCLGGSGYLDLHPLGLFFANLALMLLLAVLLLFGLLPLLNRDMFRLLLVGVIFGVLCANLREFMGRLLDPAEYSYAQDIAYAQFDTVRFQGRLLPLAGLLIGLTLGYFWQRRHVLDILALGRPTAISLGVAYNREITTLLLLVALLVAVSTALVGPVLFFGLLVSALTYRLFPTPYHGQLLPAAALLAALIIVLGQAVFEHLFHFKATLSVVIEGLGGLMFIYLLLARRKI